jgi:hypothetical protein
LRFEFLVAAVAAGGIVVGTAVETLASRSPQIFASAQPPGGVPTKITFSLADLNPLRLIYDEVMKEVTSGRNSASFAVGTPVPQQDWSKFPSMNSNFSTEFSAENMARINGENAANQIREFNNRMQDMRNYANNPAGWHGAPPH